MDLSRQAQILGKELQKAGLGKVQHKELLEIVSLMNGKKSYDDAKIKLETVELEMEIDLTAKCKVKIENAADLVQAKEKLRKNLDDVLVSISHPDEDVAISWRCNTMVCENSLEELEKTTLAFRVECLDDAKKVPRLLKLIGINEYEQKGEGTDIRPAGLEFYFKTWRSKLDTVELIYDLVENTESFPEMHYCYDTLQYDAPLYDRFEGRDNQDDLPF